MISHVVTLLKLTKNNFEKIKLHVITCSYKNSNLNQKRSVVVTCENE